MERGGVEWLSPENAIRAIEVARDANVPLLGFDGAVLGADFTQPSLADSWDYTHSDIQHDRYAHAIQFIRDRIDNGLHFEVILGK